MLDNIKCLMSLKSIDKNILDNNFDIALDKLNELIKLDYNPSITYLKRGLLCKELFMYSEAYSDFTYIIEHCSEKNDAYYERAFLNFEISNYFEALRDIEKILTWDENNDEINRIKFLSMVYSNQEQLACEFILNYFDNNKYKSIQFLFNEVALVLSKDEYSNGIKLLNIIDIIDKNNPLKLLKEANIYGLAGDKTRQNNILEEINNIFPKYFISHYKFKDMYQDKDLLEICFLLELSIFDKENKFAYPLKILEGYKNYLQGHIVDSKICFEEAIKIDADRADAYVLLAQTLQLMSNYDNKEYIKDAENNYRIAEQIYIKNDLPQKADEMKKELMHINSSLNF